MPARVRDAADHERDPRHDAQRRVAAHDVRDVSDPREAVHRRQRSLDRVVVVASARPAQVDRGGASGGCGSVRVERSRLADERRLVEGAVDVRDRRRDAARVVGAVRARARVLVASLAERRAASRAASGRAATSVAVFVRVRVRSRRDGDAARSPSVAPRDADQLRGAQREPREDRRATPRVDASSRRLRERGRREDARFPPRGRARGDAPPAAVARAAAAARSQPAQV
mmetsp:Transcript_9036/g.32983  ORF Transcript_9036/g.32983 Transcript_9036/m.32983 type:complete len:229 (+) Transcript_9036:1163-1849(+)